MVVLPVVLYKNDWWSSHPCIICIYTAVVLPVSAWSHKIITKLRSFIAQLITNIGLLVNIEAFCPPLCRKKIGDFEFPFVCASARLLI